MFGLPKSTDNKVIELFTGQYSWENTNKMVRKSIRELMPLWEKREIEKIKVRKIKEVKVR